MSIKSEAGEAKLFSELPMGRHGARADKFSKWFARFLKNAEVAVPKRNSTRPTSIINFFVLL